MGKRLRQQRRGKGTVAYTRPPKASTIEVSFPSVKPEASITGEVTALVDDPGHKAPLMEVRYEDGSESMLIAAEGVKVGDRIEIGGSSIKIGSVVQLAKIPDGMPVYNVEAGPLDGGRFARSAGSYATVVAHLQSGVNVLMPSKQVMLLNGACRAQIGAAAGGGAGAQPLIKAGKSHHIRHAVNAFWPRNRGVKMNPVDHPFGGKQHHKGKSSMTSWNAPPGRKVGHIGASRVGRKKRG